MVSVALSPSTLAVPRLRWPDLLAGFWRDRDANAEMRWTGDFVGGSCDDGVAMYRVPKRESEGLLVHSRPLLTKANIG